MPKAVPIPLLILLLFTALSARLAYGLCEKFWSTDEIQIYLNGLKYFSTHQWPFYGPDVVYTRSQIPGALLGLLVGIPLRVLPIPEAPFLFLNIISFSALLFFASYCRRCFPSIPQWILYPWLLFAPWTLNFSTHIINPSYVLPAAILFWVSFLESIPTLSKRWISIPLAFFIMGGSLLWIYQLHMSWVLLLPFALAAFYFLWKNTRNKLLSAGIAFVCGAVLVGSLILPTVITYGFHNGTGANVVFNTHNLSHIVKLIVRFLSFSTFAQVGTMGKNIHDRLQFMSRHLWFLPFIVISLLGAAVQSCYLIVCFFRTNQRSTFNASLKYLTIAALVITYVSFLFSIKAPATHTFYLLLPVAMLYCFSCFEPLFKHRSFRLLALAIILCGLFSDVTIANDNFYRRSLYRDRPRVVEAIAKKDYRILGLQRLDAGYVWE